MTTDVLIIGGGMAGTAAALAAAQAGASVTMVRAGPGATALAAGAWPHAPPPAVADALATAGIALTACPGSLPHPHGHLVASAVAPRAHAAAALDGDTADAGVLVLGIAGLPSFRAAALAALWADAAGRAEPLRHATITIADTPPGGWSTAALAALLEREPGRLADAVADAAHRHQAGRVIVPAVLGTVEHSRVFDALQAAGPTVGEALGVAPSLPGWRLDRALMRALDTAQVDVVTGRVTAHTAHDGVLSNVTIAATAGDVGSTTISASSFVLATGKFIGGGITTSDRFTDTVFGSDVAIRRFDRSFSEPDTVLALTDAVRTEPQPVMAAGVATDDAARMVTASGDVVFSNVFVAGSVRGGVETAALDLGSAAHDGWAAGLRAGG